MEFRYKTETVMNPVTLESNEYFSYCSCNCYTDGCATYDGDVPEGFPFEVNIRCYKLVTNGGVQSIEYDSWRAGVLELEADDDNDKYEYIVRQELKSEVVTLEEADIDLSDRIADNKDDIDEHEIRLDNHGERITILELDVAGVEHNLKNGNNNLLYGTELRTQKSWLDNGIQGRYVESPNPPEYSSEWWFGGYWYCTKTENRYQRGKMYHYNNGVWEISSETRKSLNENHFIYGLEFVENDYSKTNFICGRNATLNGNETRTVGLSQLVTPISNKFKNLILSFKALNTLTQGEVDVLVDFYNKYDLSQYLRTEELVPMYRQELVAYPDDLNTLSLVEMDIPIQKDENLLYGVYSSTAPTDTTKYWINTADEQLYEYIVEEEGWVLSTKSNTVKDGTTYYTKTRDAYTEEYVYVALDYGMPSYQTIAVRVTIRANLSYVGYVGETAPTERKGLLWGQESTDKIFRAKYIGNTFDEWVEIDTTYTEAVENGTSTGINIPFVYPKGIVTLSDIKLEYENRTEWTVNEREILGRNLDISDNGIRISDGDNALDFNEDEIKITRNDELVFDVSDDLTYSKRRKTLEDDIDGLITKKMTANQKTFYVRYIR